MLRATENRVQTRSAKRERALREPNLRRSCIPQCCKIRAARPSVRRQLHPGIEQKGNLMPVYLCRWPNGDVSLAAGESEVEIAEVLDEVENPDAADRMELAHAIAVHFKLGPRPDEEGTLPLRF